MTEREIPMQQGQEHLINRSLRIEVGAALNQHAIAKDNASLGIDVMRQQETMDRILRLAAVEKGLAEIIEASKK